MFKKVISLASLILILGGTISVNAQDLSTYSPETGEIPHQGVELKIHNNSYNSQTRTNSANYISNGFRNYAQTTQSFKLSGTQSIKNGHQKTKTATASTGVQYQIVTSTGTKLKYVTRTGVYTGNLSINMSHSGAAGTNRKLRLANYYNLSFTDTNAPVQSASGTFVY